MKLNTRCRYINQMRTELDHHRNSQCAYSVTSLLLRWQHRHPPPASSHPPITNGTSAELQACLKNKFTNH